MENVLKPSQAARYLGITTETLRNWIKSNKLLPHKDDKGKSYYTIEQLNNIREMDISVQQVILPNNDLENFGQFLINVAKKYKNVTIKQLAIAKKGLFPGASLLIITDTSMHAVRIPFNEYNWAKSLININESSIDKLENQSFDDK